MRLRVAGICRHRDVVKGGLFSMIDAPADCRRSPMPRLCDSRSSLVDSASPHNESIAFSSDITSIAASAAAAAAAVCRTFDFLRTLPPPGTHRHCHLKKRRRRYLRKTSKVVQKRDKNVHCQYCKKRNFVVFMYMIILPRCIADQL